MAKRKRRKRLEPFVSVSDTAILLGCSRATLYRAINNDDCPLPVRTFNRRKCFARVDIARFIPGLAT